ncbi:MAG TPA: phage GP46 family protein [Gammaproteobacteria bacterium]
MDIALLQAGSGFDFDIGIDAPDLTTDHGLRTAITISLFTDRSAEVSDDVDTNTNRRGWWADILSEVQGDNTGSRLWLLGRSKQTKDTLLRAKEHAQEALQWLLDDGAASRLLIETEWVARGTLGIRVQIYKAAGEPFDQVFEYSLEAL